MALVRFCDYCDVEIKGDRFLLTIQKNNVEIAATEQDLCMKCRNNLTEFLNDLKVGKN